MISSYAQTAQVLADASSVCVVTHIRPDADAIGSAVALTRGLRALGTDVSAHVGQRAPIPDNLLTIPGAELVTPSEQLPAECDLIVTVDCGSVERTGLLADHLVAATDRVLVIDHHATNHGFGAYNLIDRVESTTVIIHDLLTMLDVRVDPVIAHALYAGLMTDTGSFRWGTPRMHQLAAQWVAQGLDTRRIANDLLDHTTVADITMFGHVLSGIEVQTVGDYTAAILVADRDTTAQATESAVESLVDFIRALVHTDIGVVFKEQQPQEWAVSLRSVHLDVSAIAVGLGGGGHIPAAGYTAHGSRDAVISELLIALR